MISITVKQILEETDFVAKIGEDISNRIYIPIETIGMLIFVIKHPELHDTFNKIYAGKTIKDFEGLDYSDCNEGLMPWYNEGEEDYILTYYDEHHDSMDSIMYSDEQMEDYAFKSDVFKYEKIITENDVKNIDDN